ncbi:hypothetical protein F0726_00349 [Acidithiobacillus caldus]|nr:hypothetical protein F0726_00349 [Acidithiobacillus caldus]
MVNASMPFWSRNSCQVQEVKVGTGKLLHIETK